METFGRHGKQAEAQLKELGKHNLLNRTTRNAAGDFEMNLQVEDWARKISCALQKRNAKQIQICHGNNILVDPRLKERWATLATHDRARNAHRYTD